MKEEIKTILDNQVEIYKILDNQEEIQESILKNVKIIRWIMVLIVLLSIGLFVGFRYTILRA